MSDLCFRRRREHLMPQAEGFRLGATETAETKEKEYNMASSADNPGRVTRIMQSYEGLPRWVKIWMNFVLGPINLATLFFLSEPSGGLIAALAIGGMVLTVALVIANAGFEKIVAAGHILPWVPLVAMLAFARPDGSELYQAFLMVLLIANSISLLFDLNDVRVALWSKNAHA